MKKIIFIILLISVYSFGQTNKLVREQQLTDSLDALRGLIGTGGVPLPDSVLFSTDSTAQRIFSDLKYVDKTTAQTIIAQKNFSGTVKFGSDSTWVVTKDSIIGTNTNKVLRWRYAGVNNSYITGTHRTLYSGVPDYVHWISSYNTTPSGAKIDTTDIRASFFMESNYWNGTDSLTELNYEIVLTDGTNFRPLSFATNRNRVGITDWSFNGKMKLKPTTVDSVAAQIEDWGYASRSKLRWYNVTNGAIYDMNLSDNTLTSDLALNFGGSAPVMQWNNLKTMVNGGLYITGADYNMTSNTDTAMHLSITSPGYGKLWAKNQLYLAGGEVLFSDNSFNPKLIWNQSSGNLTLGSTNTVGLYRLYAGSLYMGETLVLDTNLVLQNVAITGQRFVDGAASDTTLFSSAVAVSVNYNTTHPDTAFTIKNTSPGYGIIDAKTAIYLTTGEFNISDDEFNRKLVFSYATGDLTLGALEGEGTGNLYADDINSDSIETRIIDATEYYINGSPMSLGGAIGNADSLGSIPASSYMLKSDSTIYLTPSDAASAYSTTSHTHTDFFDTLSYSINIPDTVIAGDNAMWKIPNNITITEIAAFTNSGTVTFNIEERAEVTPNTAGTDVIGSDLVADTDQQETSTFSNASIDRDDWLALVVASITGDPTLFGITIRYIKAN